MGEAEAVAVALDVMKPGVSVADAVASSEPCDCDSVSELDDDAVGEPLVSE